MLENGTIVDMVALDPVAVRNGNAKRPEGAAEIDATGKYVLPGLINIHGHIQDERGGAAQPYAYQNKLWLASGITTVRDVSAGADAKAFIELRAQSASGAIEAPRFFICAGFSARPSPRTPEQARARVQELKKIGVDCIKIVGLDRDIMSAMLDEAHKVGLPVAHHAGVEEINAWDDIHYGTSSIEHWYGVPDAAMLDRSPEFSVDYNYSDEVDRFRYAGRLWREADPKRLDMVLDSMVAKGVAWNPDLVIYKASRDLQRAQDQPWFEDYLHPTLEEYFRPDPSNHGSYFLGWSTTDEAYWRENYRIWMDAVREFGRKGGLIGAARTPGFIYQMYGFGLVRELELQQEAGFHPIKVIEHTTLNNARIPARPITWPGADRSRGRPDRGERESAREPQAALCHRRGQHQDGKTVHTGGVEWTIKDGIPYNGPRLMREVKEMVASAQTQRSLKTGNCA